MTHAEGLEQGRWVLLDFVDFVVHVFHPSLRAFYQLERLWGDAAYRDYYTLLVEDCVAAFDPELHEASLLVQRRRHDVATAETVLTAWRKARANLDPLPGSHMGIALGEFREALAKFFEDACDSATLPPRPAIRRARESFP